jgi:hypothetical protein
VADLLLFEAMEVYFTRYRKTTAKADPHGITTRKATARAKARSVAGRGSTFPLIAMRLR